MDDTDERARNAMKTFRRLQEAGLMRGAVLGGCAYALLIGDWSDVRDIDLDVEMPCSDWPVGLGFQQKEVWPGDLVKSATDDLTGIIIDFVGPIDFVRIFGHGYETVDVSGVEVMCPADLVDRFSARGRKNLGGDRDLERGVTLIQTFGLTPLDRAWKEPKAAAEYFETAHNQHFNQATSAKSPS